MSRILGLAVSGFGKTTAIGRIHIEKPFALDIMGLDPLKTYIVSTKSKPLPWATGAKDYPHFHLGQINASSDIERMNLIKPKLKAYRRVITNQGEDIAAIFNALLDSPFDNIVWDDGNYVMQDYYMDNAMKQGWDAPKKIGFFMGKIFKAIDKYEGISKNIIVLAHPQFVKSGDGREYAKFKTTGNMVDDYSTPEGMFDVVLVGKSRYDASTKTVIKQFITNEDEHYSSPKSPLGMFEDLYIPNDLGYVVEKVNNYYKGIVA